MLRRFVLGRFLCGGRLFAAHGFRFVFWLRRFLCRSCGPDRSAQKAKCFCRRAAQPAHPLQKASGFGLSQPAPQPGNFTAVSGYATASCALGHQQAACFQLLQGTLHGVWVYRRLGRQLSHGGQPRRCGVLARRNSQLQLLDQLQVNRPVGCDLPIHAISPFCIIVLSA